MQGEALALEREYAEFMRYRGGELKRLETLVGYALRRAQAAVSRSFVATFADLDVRQTQLGLLSVVHASPGIKPSRAGALLGIKRANVGPLIETLEQRELVRREASANDRRSQALFLTTAGMALLQELYRREAVHEALIASLLNATERAQLLALLGRVAEGALAGSKENDNAAA